MSTLYSCSWMVNYDEQHIVAGSKADIFHLAQLLRIATTACYIVVTDCSTGQIDREWMDSK